MNELTVHGKPEYMDAVLGFIESQLDDAACSEAVKSELLVAVEEIFVNIYSYAYPPKEGDVCIRTEIAGNPAVMRIDLIDQGIPYNPLEKADPDITLSVEERQIGGLGIFMVKQSMDKVEYRYEDSKNILTLYKTI